METFKINGKTLEYDDDEHIYLVDGVIVPSVTQVLKAQFGSKYSNVDPEVLRKAAEKGTATHKAIENYCKLGEESDLPELRNFKFLQKNYGFEVVDNEVPVIIEIDDFVCAGRLDLVLKLDGILGGADIKRTSVLDKEYLGYQLNLYRIGYLQCYGAEWQFLRGIHLRDDVRKFVNIPVREEFIISWVRRMRNEGKIPW